MFEDAMIALQSAIDANSKIPSRHLFLRQQHTVQIIQLVEGPPPTPRSIVDHSSDASSSYSSSYSDSTPSTNDDDDDQSLCSSYCSSDDSPPNDPVVPPADPFTETHSVRMKRILAWRENFSTHLSATLSEPSLSSSLKRKIHIDDGDDDTMSHTSKRSRSQASQGDVPVISLGLHACPACDASFSTRESLLRHGRDAAANEACCAAVEYAFE